MHVYAYLLIWGIKMFGDDKQLTCMFYYSRSDPDPSCHQQSDMDPIQCGQDPHYWIEVKK
jgi:hypothetical protein